MKGFALVVLCLFVQTSFSRNVHPRPFLAGSFNSGIEAVTKLMDVPKKATQLAADMTSNTADMSGHITKMTLSGGAHLLKHGSAGITDVIGTGLEAAKAITDVPLGEGNAVGSLIENVGKMAAETMNQGAQEMVSVMELGGHTVVDTTSSMVQTAAGTINLGVNTGLSTGQEMLRSAKL